MNNLDPARLEAALAAIPGAALYGMYHLAVLIKSGRRPGAGDVMIVVINLVCAIACGVLLAWVFALSVAHVIPWSTLKDPALVGFCLGAFGWELLPLAYGKLAGRAKKEMDRFEGGGQ